MLMQVVYKRYASLYFVMGIDSSDNELITLELVHHFVEVLDRYFGNVCELDLIFNFHKVAPLHEHYCVGSSYIPLLAHAMVCQFILSQTSCQADASSGVYSTCISACMLHELSAKMPVWVHVHVKATCSCKHAIHQIRPSADNCPSLHANCDLHANRDL